MRTFLAALFGVLLSLPSSSRAQTEADGWAPPVEAAARPTSGDASLLSGRTLGNGEVLLAAALGWPGLWAQLELAPSATFNLGIRAGVVYGSPVMGLAIGAGGQLTVPMRIWVWGEHQTDLSIRVAPSILVGEGILAGEAGLFAHELGLAGRLDAGVVFGFQADPRITLLFGADLGGGVSWVNGANAQPIGVLQGRLGLEGLLARDTMLFAELTAGGGLAPDRAGVPLYPDRFALGLSLGIGYLL